MTIRYEITSKICESKIGHCTRWLAKIHGSKFIFCTTLDFNKNELRP